MLKFPQYTPDFKNYKAFIIRNSVRLRIIIPFENWLLSVLIKILFIENIT